MMTLMQTARQYQHSEQFLYLGELAIIAIGLFVGGFILLRSTREKDQENKFYGWIFYGAAYIVIIMMWVLVLSFV